MKSLHRIPLGEITAPRIGTIDPSKYPDESFELYSIPAFDKQKPELVRGSAIGSSKQLVQPGDVLLSKIVPHIRRAWVVGQQNGQRLLASSEWIVFRNERTHPQYLRHVLVGDEFHTRFMSTVAGVGGSLLRARPAHVAAIEVPLPPISEQRRIAAILDHADALRAKRRACLLRSDELRESFFHATFGDPATNPRRFPLVPLASLVRRDDGINYGVVQPGDEVEDGIPLVRVGDLSEGRVSHANLKRISPSIEAMYKRSRLRGDEVLVSCVGSTGMVAEADKSLKGFNIARAVARIPLGPSVERGFVAAHLRSKYVQSYFRKELRTVSQPTLNIKQIEQTPVILPPIELQRSFMAAIETVEALYARMKASEGQLDRLFSSLQHRAIRGEL
jgi:type I restriction enzyme, S subunit